MIKTFDKVPVTSYPHYNNGFYYVPDDYDQHPDKVYPTILFFHGKGECGKDINKLLGAYLPKRIRDGWKPQATNPITKEVEDFIVIAVQDQSWSPYPTPMSYALSFFKGTEKLRIDEGRVYSTGLSSGGQTSLMYGCWTPDSPKLVAAIATFSVAALEKQAIDNLDELGKSKTPIWISSGDNNDDGHFRGNGNTYGKIIKDNGGDVTFTTHSGGHCCWDQYYNGTKKVPYNGKEYTLYEWFLLFGSTPPPRQPKEYIVEAKADGTFSAADGDYIPGDTLILKGSFKSFSLQRISGTSEKPITIINNGNVSIGDPNGTNTAAFSLRTCKHIKVVGESKESFIIDGSVGSGRSSYFGIVISQLSENISVENITIRNCGIALQCKTSPTEDPLTWNTNPPLENFTFKNLEITGASLEAMYIGDTSGYYDLTDKKQVYITPDQFDPTHTYVEQRLLGKVTISDVYVHNVGWDGIQTAAIADLTINNCEVTNWATAKNGSHNGGILVGGKVQKSRIYCNHVHDGYGELLQYYATGTDHEVYNNLFVGSQLNGASFRTTNNGTVNFHDNTVAKTVGPNIRVYSNRVDLKNVYLAQPAMGTTSTSTRMFIYLEAAGSASENNVTKEWMYDSSDTSGYKPSACGDIDPDPVECPECPEIIPCPPCPECPECEECPPIPSVPVPVGIETWVIMSDGTKYKV